jgi:hypothetical protein
MGMSTHVVGFRPPDDRWRQMKAVWDACAAAGTSIPDEVDEFFNGEAPDDAGVTVDIPTHEWSDEHSREGYEIHLDELPADIKTIRFYNSW